MQDKKLEAFNKNKVEDYKASCKLEILTVEAAPHPDLHQRYEVRSKEVDIWCEYLKDLAMPKNPEEYMRMYYGTFSAE